MFMVVRGDVSKGERNSNVVEVVVDLCSWYAENDHLTCSLLVLGVKPSKRRPIESTITLDQPPHKLKSARKKQTNASPPLGHHTAAVWAQPTRIT